MNPIKRFHDLMGDNDNRPYPEDAALLTKLGLPLWGPAKAYEEVFIGEVRPFAEDEPPGEETVIQVYVKCAPAQFFRFVVTSKSASDDYDGMERVEVETGSGLLAKYWPMALAVANHSLVVGPVVRVSTAAASNGQ